MLLLFTNRRLVSNSISNSLSKFALISIRLLLSNLFGIVFSKLLYIRFKISDMIVFLGSKFEPLAGIIINFHRFGSNFA